MADAHCFKAVVCLLLAANARCANDSHVKLLVILAIDICQRLVKMSERYHTRALEAKVVKTCTCVLLAVMCSLHEQNNRNIQQMCTLINKFASDLMTYKSHKKGRVSIQPILLERAKYGEFNHLVPKLRYKDRDNFIVYFRMSPERYTSVYHCKTTHLYLRFDWLLERLSPSLELQHNNSRKSISPGEQLALTLQYLAHGKSQRILALEYRLGRSTTCQIIRKTCKAIWDILKDEYLHMPSETDWTNIAQEFWTKWNYPNCVGAIDGKRVIIHAPKNQRSGYFNHKGADSLVLLASCDANYRFTWVDVGGAGLKIDGCLFAASVFGQRLANETLNLPPPKPLPKMQDQLPYIFVADEAFPLQRNLMRPYPAKNLQLQARVFNYRLSRAQHMIENTFGILVARWRVFRQPIIADISTVESIVMATVCLHNFLQTHDIKEHFASDMYNPPRFADYEDINGHIYHGAWRNQTTDQDAIRDITTFHRNQYTTASRVVRDAFASYFSSPCGAVPWQDDVMNQGINGRHHKL